MKRKLFNCDHSSISSFSSKIVCSEYGRLYGSKIWNSNSKYKKDYKTVEKLFYNPFFILLSQLFLQLYCLIILIIKVYIINRNIKLM